MEEPKIIPTELLVFFLQNPWPLKNYFQKSVSAIFVDREKWYFTLRPGKKTLIAVSYFLSFFYKLMSCLGCPVLAVLSAVQSWRPYLYYCGFAMDYNLSGNHHTS
jgi:hypothetical protein